MREKNQLLAQTTSLVSLEHSLRALIVHSRVKWLFDYLIALMLEFCDGYDATCASVNDKADSIACSASISDFAFDCESTDAVFRNTKSFTIFFSHIVEVSQIKINKHHWNNNTFMSLLHWLRDVQVYILLYKLQANSRGPVLERKMWHTNTRLNIYFNNNFLVFDSFAVIWEQPACELKPLLFSTHNFSAKEKKKYECRNVNILGTHLPRWRKMGKWRWKNKYAAIATLTEKMENKSRNEEEHIAGRSSGMYTMIYERRYKWYRV